MNNRLLKTIICVLNHANYGKVECRENGCYDLSFWVELDVFYCVFCLDGVGLGCCPPAGVFGFLLG